MTASFSFKSPSVVAAILCALFFVAAEQPCFAKITNSKGGTSSRSSRSDYGAGHGGKHLDAQRTSHAGSKRSHPTTGNNRIHKSSAGGKGASRLTHR
jgi:hypothetical protein